MTDNLQTMGLADLRELRESTYRKMEEASRESAAALQRYGALQHRFGAVCEEIRQRQLKGKGDGKRSTQNTARV